MKDAARGPHEVWGQGGELVIRGELAAAPPPPATRAGGRTDASRGPGRPTAAFPALSPTLGQIAAGRTRPRA